MASIEVSLSNALEQGGVLLKPGRTMGSHAEQTHCFASEAVSEQHISNVKSFPTLGRSLYVMIAK